MSSYYTRSFSDWREACLCLTLLPYWVRVRWSEQEYHFISHSLCMSQGDKASIDGRVGQHRERGEEGERRIKGERGRGETCACNWTQDLLGRRPLEMSCSLGPCRPNPPASAFWLQDRCRVLGLSVIFTDLSSFTKQWIVAQGKILSFSVFPTVRFGEWWGSQFHSDGIINTNVYF